MHQELDFTECVQVMHQVGKQECSILFYRIDTADGRSGWVHDHNPEILEMRMVEVIP